MRAKDFIKEKPKGILTIFDIDDTLFHTTAKINVVKDGKVTQTLTNQEFNNYELDDGEEFDFGEFRNAEKFRQESEPIGPMLDELKTILDHTRGKVIMLTARADFDDKDTFLQTFADHGIDMSKIHVHRAGNLPGKEGPADKKAVWVRRYLDTGKFNQVSLYDDSTTNLRVFKQLEQEYPDVKFDAYHITGNGDVASLEERKRRKKRKSKTVYGAAWGPGPYGLYGTNTGYSGSGTVGDGGGLGGDGGGTGGESINESWTPDKKQRIKEFAIWAIKLLEIEQAPRIRLVADSGTTALGYFDTESKEIVVTYKDRHQMDIMRTLAHELVHRKQLEFRELDGATGSNDENEANAIAGVLLRKWGKQNPDQFNESSQGNTNLDSEQKETSPEFVEAVDNWQQMWDTEEAAKVILNSRESQPFRRPPSVQKLYRAIIPKDRELSTIKANGSVVAFSTNLKGAINFVQTLETMDDWIIIEKSFSPSEFLLDYTSMIKHYKLSEFDRYVDEYEVWMKPSAFYTSAKKDEVVYTSKEYYANDVNENFADGKNPQDKGDSKRHGISKGTSIADLKKIRSSDSASPRKKQLAHWQINMRQGKKK
jgi:hypothetical protein